MVYDLAGRELIELAAALGEELSSAGEEDFFIGTGARVFRPDEGWRAESLTARAAAGARFIQTSPCFDMNILRDYMKRVVGEKLTWSYSVVVTLSPLTSANAAKWMKQNMTDSRIPESLIQRLEEAQDPEQEGIRICAELMQEVSEIPGISGVNLMTTGNSASILAAIEASDLRS
jgi:methylenetetrahydrofolate reductase (NADPH)